MSLPPPNYEKQVAIDGEYTNIISTTAVSALDITGNLSDIDYVSNSEKAFHLEANQKQRIFTKKLKKTDSPFLKRTQDSIKKHILPMTEARLDPDDLRTSKDCQMLQVETQLVHDEEPTSDDTQFSFGEKNTQSSETHILEKEYAKTQSTVQDTLISDCGAPRGYTQLPSEEEARLNRSAPLSNKKQKILPMPQRKADSESEQEIQRVRAKEGRKSKSTSETQSTSQDTLISNCGAPRGHTQLPSEEEARLDRSAPLSNKKQKLLPTPQRKTDSDSEREIQRVRAADIRKSKNASVPLQEVTNRLPITDQRRKDNEQLQHNGSHSSCCNHIKNFEKTMQIILKKVNYLIESSDRSSNEKNSEKDEEPQLLPDFPLASHKKVVKFNKRLQADKDLTRQFQQKIIRIGGKNPKFYVRNVLSMILPNEVAKMYTWTGRKGTIEIGGTKFIDLILDTVIETKGGDREELKNAVMTWLHHAGERWQRRYPSQKRCVPLFE